MNCTVFAYGQTGTGKTFTMLGKGIGAKAEEEKSIEQLPPSWYSTSARATALLSLLSCCDCCCCRGIIPRAVHDIFNGLGQGDGYVDASVYCSFLQLYNDNVYDLLYDR